MKAENFDMNVAERIASILRDPPPAMAFEISEAGVTAARMTGPKTEFYFHELKPGTLSVSPLKDNVIDISDFSAAVKAVSGGAIHRKKREVTLILPDYCTRTAVLDFDSFPTDPKEQLSLIRFRVKRSVPFDAESAALSYFPQHTGGKKFEVVVVLTPLEIVSRYEAPFRAAGLAPGMVTTSSLAALELAHEAGLTVFAKLSGRILTVLVRDKGTLKLVRCLELPGTTVEDVASHLFPTFVYVEDNLGGRVDRLLICGFGPESDAASNRFHEELGIEVEALHSPLGVPGQNNAGLLGYLRSLARNN